MVTGDLFVNEALTIPADELRISFARSGGPGGQNVNRVETKAEVRWAPGRSAALRALGEDERKMVIERLGNRVTGSGDVIVNSDRTREQARNREDAMRKLAALVGRALKRPKKRKPTQPSKSAVQRRLSDKKHRSELKKQRRARGEE